MERPARRDDRACCQRSLAKRASQRPGRSPKPSEAIRVRPACRGIRGTVDRTSRDRAARLAPARGRLTARATRSRGVPSTSGRWAWSVSWRRSWRCSTCRDSASGSRLRPVDSGSQRPPSTRPCDGVTRLQNALFLFREAAASASPTRRRRFSAGRRHGEHPRPPGGGRCRPAGEVVLVRQPYPPDAPGGGGVGAGKAGMSRSSSSTDVAPNQLTTGSAWPQSRLVLPHARRRHDQTRLNCPALRGSIRKGRFT